MASLETLTFELGDDEGLLRCTACNAIAELDDGMTAAEIMEMAAEHCCDDREEVDDGGEQRDTRQRRRRR